jgi:uncharacterized protein (DUF433 family)
MSKVIVRDKDILGGLQVFAGTRVPVKALFDYLEAGDSIQDFADDFPSVTPEQVQMLLAELQAQALSNIKAS